MNAPFRPEPPDARAHRFTFDDVVRLSEEGYLPETGRVELVDGRIEIMPVDGDLHDCALSRLVRFFNKSIFGNADLAALWDVRAKGTLRISEHHAREPDLMIIALFDDVRAVRPSDVLLIAETCVSSTTRDLKEKRQAYANAAIQEYWVCEVEKCALHIFRRPEDGDYAEHQILRSGEHVSPLFAPQIVFAVEALVPKET